MGEDNSMLSVAYGESTMSRIVQLCYNRFKEGRDDVNDEMLVLVARVR